MGFGSRFAYNETLKKMYSIKNLDSLPPMPEDGDTWSVMQSWALPTRSFLEFVMFSRYLFTTLPIDCLSLSLFGKKKEYLESVFASVCRMFVDSLDAQIYEEHHRTNRCYLSLTKVRNSFLLLPKFMCFGSKSDQFTWVWI